MTPWRIAPDQPAGREFHLSSLQSVLIFNFVLAVLSCAIPFIMGNGRSDIGIPISWLLSACWFASAIHAFAKFTKRGLWVMLGFPLAVVWPYITFALAYSCAVHRDCI
jgi:hypothetical protein